MADDVKNLTPDQIAIRDHFQRKLEGGPIEHPSVHDPAVREAREKLNEEERKFQSRVDAVFTLMSAADPIIHRSFVEELMREAEAILKERWNTHKQVDDKELTERIRGLQFAIPFTLDARNPQQAENLMARMNFDYYGRYGFEPDPSQLRRVAGLPEPYLPDLGGETPDAIDQ